MITAALLLGLISAAQAAPRRLAARLTDGRSTYVRTLAVEEGKQANEFGDVRGGHTMGLNAALATVGSVPRVEYQFEFGPLRGQNGPVFQVQGAVSLKPGAWLAAAECGVWRLELGLDAPAGAKASPVWALGKNARLRVDVYGGAARKVIRQVLELGAQGNIVEASGTSGRGNGATLNAVLGGTGAEPVNLDYQLWWHPQPGNGVSLQGTQPLAFGKESLTAQQGVRLSFLVEGSPARPAAAAVAAPAAPASSAPQPVSETGGAVQLLR